jgi:hypothetical protein
MLVLKILNECPLWLKSFFILVIALLSIQILLIALHAGHILECSSASAECSIAGTTVPPAVTVLMPFSMPFGFILAISANIAYAFIGSFFLYPYMRILVRRKVRRKTALKEDAVERYLGDRKDKMDI